MTVIYVDFNKRKVTGRAYVPNKAKASKPAKASGE